MIYKKLLLVHRGRRSLERLGRTLENVGHQVMVVEDASLALDFLGSENVEMIIASDNLREPDVFEFCRIIRGEDYPLLSKTRFVIISQREMPQSKRKALDAGVDEYVSESYTLPALVDRINVLLSEESRYTAPIDLSGAISQSGLVDVLQLIEFSAKSGVLTVTSGMRRGTMAFSFGQLIKARVGNTHNEAAVYEMLSWREGEFSFQAIDKIVDELEENPLPLASVSSLVLEWARYKDEGKGKPREVPQEFAETRAPHNWASSLNTWLGYLRDK